jgi:hypothetical protein
MPKSLIMPVIWLLVHTQMPLIYVNLWRVPMLVWYHFLWLFTGWYHPEWFHRMYMSVILSTVVASAGEAEYAAIFKVAQLCENVRLICGDLGYPQPATSIICDNTCAVGIVNDTCKVKRLKAIDMRFHWVRDRVRQGHFTVSWQPGKHNLADFFTKPLAVYLHKQVKQLYVHSPAIIKAKA